MHRKFKNFTGWSAAIALLALVQRGENNPPVQKGKKAYCTNFLPFGLLPPIFCLLALVAACSSTPPTQNTSEATPALTQSKTNSSSEKAALKPSGVSLPKTTHKIGEVISVNDKNPSLELTVNGIREHQGQGVIQPNRGNKWIVVSTTIANKGAEPKTLSIVSFEVVDQNNKPYEVALLASALEDVKSPSGEIKPGEERRGEVTFEVPEGAKGLKLLFKPNISECEATVAKKATKKLNCQPIVVNLE